MSMKILFIGMGSIGQRHLQNIQSLYGKDVECFAVRSTSHNNHIKDGVATPVRDLNEYYQIGVFQTLDEALNEYAYDAVFITNPSSLHSEVILKCLDYQINIFVEKPLCINLKEAQEIKNKLTYFNSILYVGYQTHFDPMFRKVYDLIVNSKLGDVVSARFEWCTFLPDHHKYEDYRTGYAARNDLGGGVLLGLSHEIDIILNFFGMPDMVKAIESSNKKLEINADDTVMVLCKYLNNNFPLSLVLSYSQVTETRGFRIQCEKGFIDCDWNGGVVSITDINKSNIPQIFESNISRNEIFISQTKWFIDAVLSKDTSITNINNSINILEFIENVKREMV
jgi:predicted dehydrogenase